MTTPDVDRVELALRKRILAPFPRGSIARGPFGKSVLGRAFDEMHGETAGMGQPNNPKGKRRHGDAGEAEQTGVEIGHDLGVTALAADLVKGQEDGGGGGGGGGVRGGDSGNVEEEAGNEEEQEGGEAT